jgi:hypothetical protein
MSLYVDTKYISVKISTLKIQYENRVCVVNKHNIPVPCSFAYTIRLPVLNGTFYFHKYLTNVVQFVHTYPFHEQTKVLI